MYVSDIATNLLYCNITVMFNESLFSVFFIKKKEKKKVAFAYKIHVCVYLNDSNKRSKNFEKYFSH